MKDYLSVSENFGAFTSLLRFKSCGSASDILVTLVDHKP